MTLKLAEGQWLRIKAWDGGGGHNPALAALRQHFGRTPRSRTEGVQAPACLTSLIAGLRPHSTWALLVLICLLAFALRVHGLGELSLWYDEGWSVHLARLTPWQALPQIAGSGHTHPPLYYLLLGVWQALAGPREFSMRFPSLAFGILTVALGYRLGRELFGQDAGLAAALLLALAPSHIAYSQEARSYTLLAMEYALLILLACRFLRRRWQLSLGDWVALIVAEAVALYTHYFALTLMAYLALVMVGSLSWNRRWIAWRRWLGAQLLVGLLYVPWIWTAVRQLGEHAPPDMRALPLRSFLGLIWRFYFSGLSWAAAHYPHFVQVTLGLAILGSVSFLVNILLQRIGSWDWLLLGCFLLPLGAVFGVEQARPGIHPRYTLMLSVPLFLLLARQVALWLRGPGGQKLAGLGLGLVILLPLGLGLQAMSREHDKDDVRGLASYLTTEATAQDLVIFDYEDFAFQYYYRGRAPVLYLEGYGPSDPLIRRVLEAAQGRESAFLVTWYTGHTDRRDMYPFLLELNGRLENDRQFRGLRLRQYELERGMRMPALAPTFGDFGPFHLTAAFWDRSTPTDGAITVALRWHLAGMVKERYKAALMLQDGAGRQIASVDSPLVNDQGRPTEEWLAGAERANYYVVPIPVGTPPLTHSLHVALYTEEAPEGLDLLSQTGAPAGKHFALGKVMLTSPSIPQRDPYRTQAQLALEPVGEQVARGLVLDAMRVDRTVAQPGTRIPVILRWRAIEDELPDYCPTLRLIRNGEILAQQRGALADGGYPTSVWRSQELVLDRRELLIGPQVSAGEARLEVQVRGGQPLALATISIEEAERLFQVPPVQYTAYARFGQVAELVGYDLPITKTTSQQDVPLTLYWRAINRETLSKSYVVFTHLLTEGGDRLVAQHDGPPSGGQKPTTGWVEGEIVIGPHLLRWREAYAGTCPIEVGLYDPATGERVPTYDRAGNRLPHDRFLLDQPVHALGGE